MNPENVHFEDYMPLGTVTIRHSKNDFLRLEVSQVPPSHLRLPLYMSSYGDHICLAPADVSCALHVLSRYDI
jgi:hypothetical protein